MGSILLFAVVLLIAGGAIAFVGDRLGTWVGKKRLSKFGLRPKHTAMLYTTVTGGIIAVLTLAMLLLIDQDVKRAITQGRQIFAQNKRYKRENRQLRELNVEARRATAEALAQASDARSEAATANRSAAVYQNAAIKAHAKLAEAQSLYRQQIALDQKQLRINQNLLAAARNRLALDRTNLALAAAGLSKANGQYRQADEKRRVAERLVAGDERELARLDKQAKSLADSIASLKQSNQMLASSNLQLKSNANIYYTGDEVDRLVVDTNMSRGDIYAKLVGWLDQLSRDASRRGAGTGSNGRDIVVQGDGGESPGDSVPEDDCLQTLADHIWEQRKVVDSVVVSAVARFNTSRQEQVRLDLHPYDNVLVISKGDVVTSTTIDGTLPQNEIVNQLISFLKDKVNPAVSDFSVMPALGEQSNQIEGHLLDTVAQIQSAGPGAKVSAVAAEDTFTQGPLNVRLIVESPPAADNGSSTPSHDSVLPAAAPNSAKAPPHSESLHSSAPVVGL